jgi:hypothetical protein
MVCYSKFRVLGLGFRMHQSRGPKRIEHNLWWRKKGGEERKKRKAKKHDVDV